MIDDLIITYWMLFNNERYTMYQYYISIGIIKKYAVEKILKDN